MCFIDRLCEDHNSIDVHLSCHCTLHLYSVFWASDKRRRLVLRAAVQVRRMPLFSSRDHPNTLAALTGDGHHIWVLLHNLGQVRDSTHLRVMAQTDGVVPYGCIGVGHTHVHICICMYVRHRHMKCCCSRCMTVAFKLSIPAAP